MATETKNTIALFLKLFLESMERKGNSHATIKNYRSDIQQFINHNQISDPNQLFQKSQIIAFILSQNQKGLKLNSVIRKIASITQFAFWSKNNGYYDGDLSWFEEINNRHYLQSLDTAVNKNTHQTRQQPTPNSYHTIDMPFTENSYAIKSTLRKIQNKLLPSKKRVGWRLIKIFLIIIIMDSSYHYRNNLYQYMSQSTETVIEKIAFTMDQKRILGTNTTTQKNKGQAQIKAGKNEVTISSKFLTNQSTIHLTATSSTHNRLIYIKSQTPDNPETEENEGQFTVGYDGKPLDINATFNWLIIQ